MRRKLEKQRKVEVYADADEILQEEIKEYKVRRKEEVGWLATQGKPCWGEPSQGSYTNYLSRISRPS